MVTSSVGSFTFEQDIETGVSLGLLSDVKLWETVQGVFDKSVAHRVSIFRGIAPFVSDSYGVSVFKDGSEVSYNPVFIDYFMKGVFELLRRGSLQGIRGGLGVFRITDGEVEDLRRARCAFDVAIQHPVLRELFSIRELRDGDG